MGISDKDQAFMQEVAAYFRLTIDPVAMPQGSIRDTANHFNLTRTKVQKILITTGDYKTAQTMQIQAMRNDGLSVKEIAGHLDLSEATVSSSLPYDAVFYGTAEPSEHALEVREYRAYEKAQKKRQVNAKNEAGGSKTVDKKAENDWKRELDSKLSFTPSESRRPRITQEMVDQSGFMIGTKAVLEASGIELPVDEDGREELRAKEHLTPDEVLDLGEFPGALCDRNPYDLEELYGEQLPYEPREMIRLHMELIADFTPQEKEIMRKYGKMEGDTISRDVLVSDDLPLYALHYVIQRVFGWQNSHLHRFYVGEDVVARMTGNVERWKEQVGVIYRSPLMDEEAEFWADDYNGGSFKNWLRKKYTGPCVSQCWAEGLIACHEDMEKVDLDEKYYVEYGRYGSPDSIGTSADAIPLRCRPVVGWDGKKNEAPKADSYVKNFRVEVVKARDLPVKMLNRLFERGSFDLLERLPIGQVLAVHNMTCEDDFQDGDQISSWEEMIDDGMDSEIDDILESGFDSPLKQPFVYSFTDELLYEYDFGDGWRIRITGSRNCADLVENGKISQEILDKSNIKARVTYRPVLLARDGEMLIDDVGGTSGIVSFIEAINTMKRGETDENGMSKAELKAWAKSLGWHKDDSSDFSLL